MRVYLEDRLVRLGQDAGHSRIHFGEKRRVGGALSDYIAAAKAQIALCLLFDLPIPDLDTVAGLVLPITGRKLEVRSASEDRPGQAHLIVPPDRRPEETNLWLFAPCAAPNCVRVAGWRAGREIEERKDFGRGPQWCVPEPELRGIEVLLIAEMRTGHPDHPGHVPGLAGEEVEEEI